MDDIVPNEKMIQTGAIFWEMGKKEMGNSSSLVWFLFCFV